MGDKRKPDELEDGQTTQTLPDVVPSLLRELARTPEVFPGSVAPGSRLGGRYTVDRLVGKGGMGAVYLAIDDVLGKEVALKLVAESTTANLGRLRDEVLRAQEVTHRNVCRTYDLEEADGHWLVKMEYIDGQTLAEKVAGAGRLSVAEARAIASQIAHGLAAAHERGVVHRDLKPQNIIVEKGSKRVVLMDFGLARLSELAGQPPRVSPVRPSTWPPSRHAGARSTAAPTSTRWAAFSTRCLRGRWYSRPRRRWPRRCATWRIRRRTHAPRGLTSPRGWRS
jgi:serine/threonine protein kinase